MPTSQDLMGLGMSPFQAELQGNDVQALTATGTTQATAAAIRTKLVEMTATGSDGIILPADAKIGTPYWVFNSSGSTGKVYVPVGDTLNGVLNASLSVVTITGAVFVMYKKDFWFHIKGTAT